MYTRKLDKLLPKNASSFLFGPRQCGKTTILKKQNFLVYIDLLKTDVFLKYNRKPSYLFDELAAREEKNGLIIIDEIQKVPLLLDEVQRCMEEFKNLYFILSGSSARKLKKGGANLLGGRALDLSIFPLSFEELEGDFDLWKVLEYGSLPKISSLLAKNQQSTALGLLRSYVSTYLTEEIKAEALVRNLESFQRFLEVAAHQFAREVNQSELADQAQVSVSSVKNYYAILEDTLIGFFLHPHATSIRKQLTKTPKFYFFDNGVVRAIQGLISSKPTNKEKGYLFEQMMLLEVKKINSYYSKDFKLSFWKTAAGTEVDLLISRGNKILMAIEFKSTLFPSLRDLSGLKSFSEEYPKVPAMLCAPVDSSRMIDDKYKVVEPKELLKIVKKL